MPLRNRPLRQVVRPVVRPVLRSVLGRAGIVLLAVLMYLGALALPAAAADEPVPPVPQGKVVLTGPGTAIAGQVGTFTAVVSDPTGAPLAGAQVSLEAKEGTSWRVVATGTSDASGRTALIAEFPRRVAIVLHRAVATYDGVEFDPSNELKVAVVKAKVLARLTGPASVVDERAITLTAHGSPAARGTKVDLQVHTSGRWVKARSAKLDKAGKATFVLRPRATTRYRVVVAATAVSLKGVSELHLVRNLPPGPVVELPAKAPKPRLVLGVQKRASGQGANAVTTRIPNHIWKLMKGRSWRPGCPVGRAGLRYLRINYWGFDGYRHRGELVAAATAVGKMRAALTELYQRKIPIRSMYLVDRFGYSAKLGGANDYRSMAADNTSAFNCRTVVNSPTRRSPHSSGRSLDLNPWENPFRSASGLVPNSWWHSRTHPQVAWRARSHVVVKVMAKHGMRWTYGTGDSHHFDARG